MKRVYWYYAAAAVGVLLLYLWLKSRRVVLDAANSSSLSSLFDQLNPTVGGTTPTGEDHAAGMATGVINYIPVGGSYGNTGFIPPGYVPGQSPPIIVDHQPLPPVYA